MPFEEQYDALVDLVKEGKIKHIGLSNETCYGVMYFSKLAERDPSFPKIFSLHNAYQ